MSVISDASTEAILNAPIDDSAEKFGRLADAGSISDSRIRKERRTSDKALRSERHRADGARHQAAGMDDSAKAQCIEKERNAVDVGLAKERHETDVEMQSSADDCAGAQKSHRSARAELTTRDEFLAIVSHDLRNPIGSISMAVNLLAESLDNSSANDDAKEWVDLIRRSADEALRLISDLIDVERMAIGKLSLNGEQCDLLAIVRNSRKIFERAAAAKNVILHLDPESVAIVVTGDRDRIAQVLSNLVGNAAKFTPPGGTITLSVRVDGNEARVSVADSGPGIPENMQGAVFERFSQLQCEDRRGLGLGLYIAKMLVEAHGGRIWITSKSGMGATFHFALPLWAR